TVSPWVDETHRHNNGKPTARIKKQLPTPSKTGCPATPQKKRNKTAAAKFGGIIDAYTIDEAVRDKAVTPLLYECRRVPPGADRRIFAVARDISEHFSKNVAKPFKSQLATESKIAAIKYKQCLDEIGLFPSQGFILSPQA